MELSLRFGSPLSPQKKEKKEGGAVSRVFCHTLKYLLYVVFVSVSCLEGA